MYTLYILTKKWQTQEDLHYRVIIKITPLYNTSDYKIGSKSRYWGDTNESLPLELLVDDHPNTLDFHYKWKLSLVS